jgi:hypothetical protein
MTDRDVSDDEMLYFLSRTRSDVRALDALLSGDCAPADAPAELRLAVDVLTVLRGPADQYEVAGWGQALVAFRELAGQQRSRPSPRWRAGLIASLLGARLAVAGAGVAMAAVLGGGIAAYTGSLPAVLQKIAHETIAAPDVHSSKPIPARQRPGHPVGPSAAGSAEHGLCNAYQHGDAKKRAVAFRNLVAAAGGVGKVAAYCAQPAQGTTSSPGRRTGQVSPSAHPTNQHKPAVPSAAVSHGNGNGVPHPRWKVVASSVTGAGGTVTFSVAPRVKTQVELEFAGDASYRKSRSNVVTLLPVR